MSETQLAVLPSAALARQVEPAAWNALKEIYDGASDEKVALVIDYCKARKLDPLKKPVHIVQVWSQKRGQMVETIWPSIAETRITAMRTGVFAGQDETKFGPTITADIGSAKSFQYPEWAQTTLYRMVGGVRCPFPGPRVYWVESYAPKKRDDPTPNAMWFKRSWGQIEKCAEAAALRRAFPEEAGGQATGEEMAGRVDEDFIEVGALPSVGTAGAAGDGTPDKRPPVPGKKKKGIAGATPETTPPETQPAVGSAEPPIDVAAKESKPEPETKPETKPETSETATEELPEWPKTVVARVTQCQEVGVSGNPKVSKVKVAFLGGGTVTLNGAEVDVAQLGRVIFDPENAELNAFARVDEELVEFTIAEEKSASNPSKMNRVIKKAKVANVAM